MNELAKATESLLLGNGAQLEMLDVDAAGVPAAAYEFNEQFGRFTAERIFCVNARLYHAIASLLARGLPYREISEICGVSVNSVCAISLREGTPIETLRERIGRIGLDVAFLTMEAIRDLLADPEWRRVASIKDLAIVHGIATTNAQLLLGGATQRIESNDGTPGHDDYLRFVKTVLEVSATGLNGENPPQKGAPNGAAIDVQSAVPAVPGATATERTK